MYFLKFLIFGPEFTLLDSEISFLNRINYDFFVTLAIFFKNIYFLPTFASLFNQNSSNFSLAKGVLT